MVDILGQDSNEIVAMAAVLRQGLLQGGHHIRWWLQADDIVGNRESQFDSLDQDLTRTFRKRARQGNGGENSGINLLNYSPTYLKKTKKQTTLIIWKRKPRLERVFTCWAVQPRPHLWCPLPLP